MVGLIGYRMAMLKCNTGQARLSGCGEVNQLSAVSGHQHSEQTDVAALVFTSVRNTGKLLKTPIPF